MALYGAEMRRGRNAGGTRLYNKLFTKILDSSVWLEPDQTRIIWFTLLAAMDEVGMCQFASIRNLAHRARIDEQAAQQAVDRLEAPDIDSSDPDHDGRRIERVPGGWIVLNGPKYRDLVTREVAKERTRLRVADHRAKKRGVTACNAPVTVSTEVKRSSTASEAVSTASAKAEASSEEEKINKELSSPRRPKVELVAVTAIPECLIKIEGFEKEWRAFWEMRKAIKKPLTAHAGALLLAKFSERPTEALRAIREAIMRNWQGFQWDWMQSQHISQNGQRGKMVPGSGFVPEGYVPPSDGEF